MYAVAVGEQFDAIDFHGPFTQFDDAELWGDRSGSNYWVVQLEEVNEQKGLANLFIENVDMEVLQQQYERLQEVITFVEDGQWVLTNAEVPDASILDGVVEMLGDVLPIKGVPE